MWLSHEELKPIADAVNPALTVVALAAPWVLRPVRARERLDFYARTVVSMMFMYALRAVEHSPYALGPSVGLEHYSSHTGYAVVLLTTLTFWRWWFAIVGVVVLGSYGDLMIYQHYHTFMDIAGTAVVICPLTVVVYKAKLPGRARSTPVSGHAANEGEPT
jgi:hypothetical protein